MARTGRPTDKTLINLRNTRGSANRVKTRRAAEGLQAAVEAGTVEVLPPEGVETPKPRKNARSASKDPKGRQLVGSARKQSPFLTAVDRYGGLDAKDKALIKDVWDQGLSLKDVQAVWLLNFLTVQKGLTSGTLPPTVATAALNQLTNSAVRLAELIASQGAPLPDAIRVVVDVAASVQPANAAGAPPGPQGDVLEVE